MEISPLFTSDDWKRLGLSYDSTQKDWRYALEIFDDRYRSRFIDPINALRKHKDTNIYIYSGFTIMAINCLLIETLCQFHYGVENSDKLKHDKQIAHIQTNRDVFVDFFDRSKEFNGFTEEISEIFYYQIRCGILHQAETKKTSELHINDKKQKDLVVLLNKKNKGLSIQRDLFTYALISEYENYKQSLLCVPIDKTKRKNFISKMSYICSEQN